jgi:NAD+ diphosphatase
MKFGNPNAFANSPLDRASHLRRDAAWQAKAASAAETLLIPLHKRMPFVTESEGRLAAGWLASGAQNVFAPGAPLLFLGLDPDGAARFAFESDDAAPFEGLGRFEELRAIGPRLDLADVAMLGCAKSMFEWHGRNGFCANCGSPTAIVEAGWKRVCATCGGEHFPRVDPVVIMLPVFGEACFLARQKVWPPGMMSGLAGFLEPGETVEEAVARETAEETALVVNAVRLHSTQPWPIPFAQLMIGAICDVESEAFTIDPHELETGRWFTRQEARALLQGKLEGYFCPPPFAIAHQLLKTWAAG